MALVAVETKNDCRAGYSCGKADRHAPPTSKVRRETLDNMVTAFCMLPASTTLRILSIRAHHLQLSIEFTTYPTPINSVYYTAVAIEFSVSFYCTNLIFTYESMAAMCGLSVDFKIRSRGLDYCVQREHVEIVSNNEHDGCTRVCEARR
jgi:hypothetical protein